MPTATPLEFDERGQLRPGIYTLTPDQVVQNFGQSSARREKLASIFIEITARLRACGVVKRCWLGGSFSSRKPQPGDIDLWIMVEANADAVTNSPVFADIFEHEQARLIYGADIFWITEAGVAGLLEAVLECLQTTKDGQLRGIVEVKL